MVVVVLVVNLFTVLNIVLHCVILIIVALSGQGNDDDDDDSN